MEDTALIMWIVTAAAGALLLLVWLRHGGAGRAADDAPDDVLVAQGPGGGRKTHFAHSVVTAHVGLALVGLGTWVMFAGNRNDPDYSPARWLSVAILVAVAILGMILYRRWQADRKQLRRGGMAKPPAEQHMPAPLVWMHGAAAVVTIALVLAVALVD